MKWIASLGLLVMICTSGCSGRYTPYVVGNVEAVSMPNEYDANAPLILVGKAQFKGNFENPVLTVVYPSNGENVIKVSAVANYKQPFMGWGIFANGASSNTVEVRGAIMLQKPGQYVVENIPTEAGMPTFRETLTIR